MKLMVCLLVIMAIMFGYGIATVYREIGNRIPNPCVISYEADGNHVCVLDERDGANYYQEGQ